MTDEDEQIEGAPTRATHTHDGQNLEELWRRFRERHDVESRNVLTEFFFDIVRANNDNIAEILTQAIEENDFYQAGVVGFLEAVNNYDPDQGVSFEEYSSLAVRRAILKEIHDLVGGDERADEA
ncbi:MAG: hypothetical protein KBG84_02325 [Planctomycetes bacterium]|nr:hypothetical protein [Planctomycetota bacterium]